MLKFVRSASLVAWAFSLSAALIAEEASSQPKPVAPNRAEMKLMLEQLKSRTSRLPLPPPTEGRGTVNNGRLRALYLPETWTAGGGARPMPVAGAPAGNRNRFPSDPSMTLDNTFKVELFWITSRANNCIYCLGHQELKLRSAGLNDKQIAALDSAWEAFPAGEQAALAFTRELTLSPHMLNAASVEPLKPYFTDPQIVEIVQTVAGYNSTNRWTDSTGIPQDQSFADHPTELNTPTDPVDAARTTRVAPRDVPARPALEAPEVVEAAWKTARVRKPSVALPELDAARKALVEKVPDAAGQAIPGWFRALSYFPQSATRMWQTRKAVASTGKLSPRIKAQIAWISARNNRAWYALDVARKDLNSQGISGPALFALDNPSNPAFTPAEQAAFAFATKLTVAPYTVADSDIAGLRKVYSDNEVAEVIYLTAAANSFDRLTEALQLPLDE